jgi:hypothetical protein
VGGRLTLILAAIVSAATLSAAGARPADPARTPVEQRMAAVVNAWTRLLDAKDNARLARLYRLPTIVIQGQYGYRLKTYKQIALFFSLLPCSGKVVSITFKGNVATAVFRLANRGATRCDAPGGLAAARFEIVDGKIADWEQIPVPPSANKPIA